MLPEQATELAGHGQRFLRAGTAEAAHRRCVVQAERQRISCSSTGCGAYRFVSRSCSKPFSQVGTRSRSTTRYASAYAPGSSAVNGATKQASKRASPSSTSSETSGCKASAKQCPILLMEGVAMDAHLSIPPAAGNVAELLPHVCIRVHRTLGWDTKLLLPILVEVDARLLLLLSRHRIAGLV